jgi:uncharacterized protein (UPF0261 family)
MLLRWLDHLPFLPLLIGALALGLAPFDEPHVWQRLKALALGQTLPYVDVLDLAMHLSLPVLLGLKALQQQLCAAPSD